MILQAALIALSTSYTAWFLQRHETQVIYPFDPTYTALAEVGESRLSERWMTTPDGQKLLIWSAEPAPGQPKLLYFPGNAGTLSSRAERFSALLDQGVGITVAAYRGSSGSGGRPSEATLMQDARQLLDEVSATHGPVILYGESLGSAVAVRLAAEGAGVGVILEAPFTSMPDLVTAQFPQEDLTGLLTQIWNTREYIKGVEQPLMIIHGTEDEFVPFDHGTELLGHAASVEKQLIAVDGAGHAGLWNSDGQRAIFDFLKRY